MGFLKWIFYRLSGIPPYPMGYMTVYAPKTEPCSFCKRLPKDWESGFTITHGDTVCCDICGNDMFWWDEEPRWYEGLTPEQIDLCIARPITSIPGHNPYAI